MNRFYTVNPLVAQPMDLGTIGKLPGELLFKVGAAQQERFDKVGKGIEDVGDLLNIKVDPKDLPELKKRQAYYNDKLTAVAKDMAENRSTTSKAAVDLLGIRKEMAKDDFLKYAPANYENILKSRQEAEKLVASGEVSPHNYVFDKDYTGWKGTLDPTTGQINTFASAGAYKDKDVRKDVEDSINNVVMSEFGDIRDLGDGRFETTKRGKITREQLINTMSPAINDIYVKNAGELSRRKAHYGNDTLGDLSLEYKTIKNKKTGEEKNVSEWKNKGLLASAIDERVVEKSERNWKEDPNWQYKDKLKREEQVSAPGMQTVSPSTITQATAETPEDFTATKNNLVAQIQAAREAGDSKLVSNLQAQVNGIVNTENEFIENWLVRNPKYRVPYETSIKNLKDPNITPAQKTYSQQVVDKVRSETFKEGGEFSTYLKENKRSSTPTWVSIPGVFATKASATPGEIKGIKYVPTNDILTTTYRSNPNDFNVVNLDGSKSEPVSSGKMVVTYMEDTPDERGFPILIATELDEDGNFTENQKRLIPKSENVGTSIKQALKAGYGDIVRNTATKEGKLKKDNNYQALVNIASFDVYAELKGSYNPNSKYYRGTYELTLEDGSKVPILISSMNAHDEYIGKKGKKANYGIEYTDPRSGKLVRQKELKNLKEVSKTITSLGMDLGAL